MKLQISSGHPDPLGITYQKQGINFSFISKEADCGIIFYDNITFEEIKRVKISKECRLGDVCYIYIEGIDPTKVAYNYYIKEQEVTDPYAHRIYDNRSYGEISQKRYGGFLDLKTAKRKNTPLTLENSIIYGMHVRGFTKHSSSKVKPKLRGTFQGIVEKIDYLKELGVTTIELQPAYEFLEAKEDVTMTPYAKVSIQDEKTIVEPTIRNDYWGYQVGNYYAPKALYGATKNVTQEFYDFVQAFHDKQMEIILQFYFPDSVSYLQIIHILHFWAKNYEIDGFHLKGNQLPVAMITQDAALSQVKLIFEEYVPTNVPGISNHAYCAEYFGQYRDSIRKLLKGDESSLLEAMSYIRGMDNDKGSIKYIADYAGFRLYDLVSYERKHNEANGEQNFDGCEQNYSWNCGEEGISRKKAIKSLRTKQIKNALTMLFVSQGTPFIFMGDEFANSQEGNNNPYCQDNEITWLNWKHTVNQAEILQFTKSCIAFRKSMPILTMSKEFKMMDHKALGYPDLSYHGEEAWNPCFAHYSRQVGSLYNCSYGNEKEKESYLYIALNLHWEPHTLGIPKLSGSNQWEVVFTTDSDMKVEEIEKEIVVDARSIIILKSKRKNKK